MDFFNLIRYTLLFVDGGFLITQISIFLGFLPVQKITVMLILPIRIYFYVVNILYTDKIICVFR